MTRTSSTRAAVERPDTPAQWYAAVAGVFLVALGVLALIISGLHFGTVGPAASQPEFLIWNVSGWLTILWIAMGALGLLAMARLDSARSYALLAGVLFAAMAIWGFLDGNDVAGIFAAGTTDNITHAVLGGLGLLTGLMPREGQRPAEGADERATVQAGGRFSRRPTGDRREIGSSR